MRRKKADNKTTRLSVGDDVEVLDGGLAMLRLLCDGMPPNNLGRVARVEGNQVFVEFPIGGSYEHSQIAPYPKPMVVKR